MVFLFVDDRDLKTKEKNKKTLNKDWLLWFRLCLLVFKSFNSYLPIRKNKEFMREYISIKSGVVSLFANMQMMFLVWSSGQSNWNALMVFISSMPIEKLWNVFWIRLNSLLLWINSNIETSGQLVVGIPLEWMSR